MFLDASGQDLDLLFDDPELEILLPRALDFACDLLPERLGACFLLTDEREPGLLLRSDGFRGDLFLDSRRPPCRLVPREGDPAAEGAYFRALRSRTWYAAQDLERDPVHRALFRGGRSALALPLQSDGPASGVLLLESERPGLFDEGRIERLRRGADLLHLHLVKAQLYDGTRDQAHPILLIGLDRATLEAAFRAAAFDVPVLLRGETGTGKELLARALHARSPRRRGPFEALNCSTLRGPLALSQLFGHVKGAFTDASQDRPGILEAADGGTLFLDELEKMPLESQFLLLRAIETQQFSAVGAAGRCRKVDVRFLAATNADLEREMAAGTFLQDLYYRINVLTLTLPPLRNRRSSLPRLLTRTLEGLSRRYGTPARRIAPRALEKLIDYPYPGNIRELQNVVTQAFIVDRDGTIDVDDLPVPVALGREAYEAPIAAPPSKVSRVEAALVSCAGNVRRAARLCGLSRTRFYALMRRLGLDPERYRPARGA